MSKQRMKNPIDLIDTWHIVDPKLILKKLRKEIKRKRVDRWSFSEGISPLDLYTYLKAKFGPPNGFQMALKSPTSDNLIHWHWTLQSEDIVMDFMGLNMRTEVMFEGYPNFSKFDGEVFENGIKNDFRNHGQRMSAVRKQLEKWQLFINPYLRLRKVVDQFADRLKQLALSELELPAQPKTSEEMKGFAARFQECSKKFTEALGLGTSLRMICPILAESFINLVIFLLAKPEIKKDIRIYNDLLRREVDVRVKSLHLYCNGFKKPIEANADEFKNFQSLMNGRNDLLHGNIDPKKLKYDTVYFDGNIPLPEKYKNFSELALVYSLMNVEPDVALKDVGIVEKFINYVLQHMDARVAKTVRMLMETPDPGWREDTMRVGILFPPYFVDFFPRSSTKIKT